MESTLAPRPAVRSLCGMSGSSYARRVLSRCIVALDAGIRISWEPGPDGRDDGARYHREEEERFLARIDAAVPAIEVLLDELEERQVALRPTSTPHFESNAQRGSHAPRIEEVEVMVWTTPKLGEEALRVLVERVAALISPPEER